MSDCVISPAALQAENSALPPIIAIAGPTAAGKTQLALDLWDAAGSGQFPWNGAEIVSVDSAQIYRGMDIGSAKPEPEIRARIPHHLLDILDPVEPYSAARFAADAGAAIAQIRQRGRVPILVGGTMLYYRALFDGLSDLPAANAEIRAKFAQRAREEGWASLHAELARLDPQTAERLHPNDAQRIGRALEVIELTGTTLAQAFERREHTGPEGTILRVAVMPNSRQELHERIALRFKLMIENGFIEEVAVLRQRPDLHLDLPSMRAVGYRQIWNYLEGGQSLDEAVQKGIAATRQYAKRQLTWLRSDPRWRALDGQLASQLLAASAATFHDLWVPQS